MSRHARASIEASVPAKGGAMKYSAPLLPAGHARAAHQLGLDLERSAEVLDRAHSHDYQLSRQIIRMHHMIWCLAFFAVLLVVIAWAPLGDWWRAITDLAYAGSDSAR